MDQQSSILRTVNVTRYVVPLREGGSLPAIVEADDGFLYVLKFRGAGQGIKSLIAELIGGEIARALGFRVPEIVFANVDEAFGRTEADEEIQDLLKFSVGMNLGLHYLSGAISFDPTVTTIDATLASQVVWLDCLITNVDRTARNTNMLDLVPRAMADRSWSSTLFSSWLGQLGRAGTKTFYARQGSCITSFCQ